MLATLKWLVRASSLTKRHKFDITERELYEVGLNAVGTEDPAFLWTHSTASIDLCA